MYDYTLTIDGHTFTNDDISTPKLRKAVSAKGFPIGEVIMGTFTVGVPPGIPPSGLQFRERAEVNFAVNTGLEQLSLGTYFIGKRKHSENFVGIGLRMALTCYDRMAYANQAFDMEGYENTEVSYSNALAYCAEKMGVAYTEPWGLGGYYLKLDRDRTIRDVLGLVAGATGTNCMMSRQDALTFVEPFEERNYYEIPSEDRTEPYVGNAWEPLKVTFYNDKNSFSAGDGDFLHEIELYNDAACQEMADFVYNKLKGHAYLPFKVKRAKVPVNTELFDSTNAWIYQEDLDGELITSRSFIANLSIDYLPDCAYATFGAEDIDEVRDEFAWLTDQDKVKKDEKNSTVQIGNRYGMKSVKVDKGEDSVGAEAATTVIEARFDNAELSFKDKTDDGKPLDGGKVFLDSEKQSINLEMKGLPTVAQDLHGAIEELFGQGASGGWVRPKEWIELPEPADNEIKMHVIVPESGDGCVGDIELRQTGVYDPSLSYSYDWGDGSTEYCPTHTYAPGQYIITLTTDTPEKMGLHITACYYITGIKVGAGFDLRYTRIAGLLCLKEIYLNGNQTELCTIEDNMNVIASCRSLEKIIIPSSIEAVGYHYLNSCNAPNGGNITMPNLKTVGDNCMTSMLGLNRLSLPSLKNAGNAFCAGNYSLTDVEIPATAQLGASAFDSCYIVNIRRV